MAHLNDSQTQTHPDWKPPRDFQLPQAIKAIALAIVFTIPFVAVGGGIMYGDYARWATTQQAALDRARSLEVLLSEPALPVISADAILRGRQLYAQACAACHSPQGTGVPGLGKSIVESPFVASLDDEDLHAFLVAGRDADHPENTLGIPMPARGGQNFNDEQLNDIVAYMRALQDPRRMPGAEAIAQAEAEAPAPDPSISESDEDMARFLAVAGGDEDLAHFIRYGKTLYASSCASCHGVAGQGVTGLGVPLVNNPFCDERDDEELLAFIKRGRGPTDPDNSTGIDMPPRGGNPALDEDDILDIIAYVRVIEQLAESRK